MTAKKVANHRTQGLGIDQLLRRHPIDVHVEKRHSLFHQPLGSRQTDPALVRQQLANCTYSAASEMVDVIQDPLTFSQSDQILHRTDKIFFRQCSLGEIDFDSEFLIDLVATNAAKIIFFGIKNSRFNNPRAFATLADRQGVDAGKCPSGLLLRHEPDPF